ncbi:hypothetical protein Bca4012_052373 [Brassica carinata]|uniref:Uncharacterized protein n=1 Tax=Brassica carinata TaxID=52824 RepID=A0A8X7SGC6_BRACI|nr:hypothetical protein Bca52824_025828 [Brassica carinata]
MVGVWRRDGGRMGFYGGDVERFEGFDMSWPVSLMEVMVSMMEGIRLRRRIVMDTHLLGPVPGCLKMTTIDPQHYLETGDIPRVAGLIEFNVDWRNGRTVGGRLRKGNHLLQILILL